MPGRVLVVDDDPSIRRLVTNILLQEGFEPAERENGTEALDYLAEGHESDLVLLDMRMPVMDGWQFAAELRRRGIEVPIVVMTAASDARRWAEQIAADGYVAKPFDVDELVAAVRAALGPDSP